MLMYGVKHKPKLQRGNQMHQKCFIKHQVVFIQPVLALDELELVEW